MPETVVDQPDATPTIEPTPIATSAPSLSLTSTPAPTATAAASPAQAPTSTSNPTISPVPTANSVVMPTPSPANTFVPDATPTPTPVPTQTVSPTATPSFDPFYSKFLDASGIPILASTAVSNEALDVARLIINKMLDGAPEIRDAMISRGVRVAVIAESEVTTDIPAHAFLKDDQSFDWDGQTRGLGGTLAVPTTSTAEENLLCYSSDRYFEENILIHEFAHTILNVGLPFVKGGPELVSRLDRSYVVGLAAGRWAQTYAATNVEEYWAEGVQSWFDANAYANPPNGIHNQVSTRLALYEYDAELADIISQVFSDDWTYSCPSN